MKKKFKFNLIFLLLLTAKLVNGQNEQSIDESDTIGDIIYMSNNLNVSKFKDGTEILEAKNNEEWIACLQKKQPAWCYYNYASENEKKFKKLYNYFALISLRGLAPNGWHIPNVFELYLIHYSEKAEKLWDSERFPVKFKDKLTPDKYTPEAFGHPEFIKNASNVYKEPYPYLFFAKRIEPKRFTHSQKKTYGYSLEKSYFFNNFECYCFPNYFPVNFNDPISKFSAGMCPSNGVFENTFQPKINDLSLSSDWSYYGSWWSSSKIKTSSQGKDNKISPLVLQASCKRTLTKDTAEVGSLFNHFLFNLFFTEGNINEGRSIICVKDYVSDTTSTTNEIKLTDSKIFSNFIILDSVKVGKPKINFVGGYTNYYSKGAVFKKTKGVGCRKIAEGDPGYKEPDMSFEPWCGDSTRYIGSRDDTTYNYKYIYSYNNELFSDLFTFENTQVRFFTLWGEAQKYKENNLRDFIRGAVATNLHLATTGYFKNYIKENYDSKKESLVNFILKNSELKNMLNNLKIAIDVSPFSSIEGLNLKYGNVDIWAHKISLGDKTNEVFDVHGRKLNYVERNELMKKELQQVNFYSLKSFSNKNGLITMNIDTFNNKKGLNLGFDISHVNSYKFNSFNGLTIGDRDNCNFNVPRKEFHLLNEIITVKIDTLINDIRRPYEIEIKKMVSNNQIGDAVNYYEKIKNNIPCIYGRNIIQKTYFDTYTSDLIIKSELTMNQIFNYYYPFLKIDPTNTNSYDMMAYSFKYRYSGSEKIAVFIKDYNLLDRKTKDFYKGLCIFSNTNTLFSFLLTDNDINSFDCQMLNSYLVYRVKYPSGHWIEGKKWGGADGFLTYSLGHYVSKGVDRYLPIEIPFICHNYPKESINEALTFINRASKLKPNAPECYIWKALYTGFNLKQIHLDQCTVSDICSQCDIIALALKNKSYLDDNYSLILTNAHLRLCDECDLCEYNICGGKGHNKKDGSKDMRYKVNK